MMLVFLYATSIMSSSSVLTTTLSNTPDSIAASTVHMNSGLPPKSTKFFLGMPLEFPRTGMTATQSVIFLLHHPIHNKSCQAGLYRIFRNIHATRPSPFLVVLCVPINFLRSFPDVWTCHCCYCGEIAPHLFLLFCELLGVPVFIVGATPIESLCYLRCCWRIARITAISRNSPCPSVVIGGVTPPRSTTTSEYGIPEWICNAKTLAPFFILLSCYIFPVYFHFSFASNSADFTTSVDPPRSMYNSPCISHPIALPIPLIFVICATLPVLTSAT